MKKRFTYSLVATLLFTFINAYTAIAQINVGDTAPDFIGNDYNGVEHHLYDYLSQGKHVLLKFGFITCAACHESNFGTNNIYYGFGCNEDDLIVLGIEVTFPGAAYQNYWGTLGGWPTSPGNISGDSTMSIPHFPEICTDGGSGTINDLYAPDFYPTYYLIEPGGEVIAGGSQSTYFNNLHNLIGGWTDVYQNLELAGIEPRLSTVAAEFYYDNEIEPLAGMNAFANPPFSELCDGGFTGSGSPCDESIPENVQTSIDLTTNSVTVTWDSDGVCDEYYVDIYSNAQIVGSTAQTTSGNSVTFETVSPGEYLVGVYCTCNETYQSSEPIGFSIAYDEIITDFTNGSCTDICEYKLYLETFEDFAGGAIDWLSLGLYIEVISSGVSGGFWLTGNETNNSWTIEACTGAPIQVIMHAEDPAGFLSKTFARYTMETLVSGDTIMNGTFGDFSDLNIIGGINEFEMLNSTVQCDIECDPAPITGVEVLNEPANILTINWDEDPGCSSYTVRWRDPLDNPPTPSGETLWNVSTIEESALNIPISMAFYGWLGEVDSLIYQIRCNCEDGGFGEWTDVMDIIADDYPYECDLDSPINVEVSMISSTSAHVSWEPGGDQPCDLFAVDFRVEGTSQWGGTVTPYLYHTFEGLTELTPSTTYEVRVGCQCDFIDYEYSDIISFTTLEEDNDCQDIDLENLTATNISLESATLQWDDSPACIGYNIRYKLENEMLWTLASSADAEIDLTGLEPNSVYEASVRCVCGSEVGAYSDPPITFSTSLNPVFESDGYKLKAYPNPVEGILNIQQIGTVKQGLHLKIVNVLGQSLVSTSINSAKESINVEQLKPGTYFMVITGLEKGQRFVEQIVVF